MASKEEIQKKITDLETRMTEADFWLDKNKAQTSIKELQDLKSELEGVGKYDKGGAIMTIFSGAGGDDAEDFSRILLEMYRKYIERKGWSVSVLSETPSQGGYRNISIEIVGKNPPIGRAGVYGILKHESGVHRLVRMSPFSAKQLRHTSFSMVEVVPILSNASDFDIPPDEIVVEFAKAGGPGGQH
ncbi:MAG: PCRF domain-containing protein, partial [Candidatus Paceibacterota bacterium]